jgi:hypothetical protein
MGDLYWNLKNKILKRTNSQHKNCMWKQKSNILCGKLCIQGIFCACVCVHNHFYPSQAQNTSGSSNSMHFSVLDLHSVVSLPMCSTQIMCKHQWGITSLNYLISCANENNNEHWYLAKASDPHISQHQIMLCNCHMCNISINVPGFLHLSRTQANPKFFFLYNFSHLQ